jgi:hypothetical protein
MTEVIITVAISLFFIALTVCALLRAFYFPRRYQALVRDWASRNGYAILTIEYEVNPLDYLLALCIGWAALLFGSGVYSYRLLIQDDQGGQTHVSVHVKGPGKPLDVRWG